MKMLPQITLMACQAEQGGDQKYRDTIRDRLFLSAKKSMRHVAPQLTELLNIRTGMLFSVRAQIKMRHEIQPIIDRCLAEMDHMRLDPLVDEQARELAIAKRQLCEADFFSRKRLLYDRIAHSRWFERWVTPSNVLLEETLKAAHQLLVACHQSYIPLPKGFWRDIHQLYAYASDHGLPTGADSSVGSLYREMLLLGLFDIGPFAPSDLKELPRFLSDYARWLNVIEGFDASQPPVHPVFLIAPIADLPPRSPASMRSDLKLEKQRVLWLDASAMLDRLTEEQETLRSEVKHARTELLNTRFSLVESFLSAWKNPPVRQFHRRGAEGKAFVITGLTSIASALNPHTAPHTTQIPLQCRYLDESDHGASFESLVSYGQVRPGELVSVRVMLKPAKLAWIRWVHLQQDQRHLHFGVEFVDGESVPVDVIACQPRPYETNQQSLLLCRVASDQSVYQIIVRGRLYSYGREFLIKTGVEQHTVRAVVLNAQTPYYQIFSIRSMDGQPLF
jgi:hypothetical protein